MRQFLNRLVKWFAVTLGVLVILLAIGVGAFRVFVARAPAYQAELQAWVAGGAAGLPASAVPPTHWVCTKL